jgi:hypothetical protein
MAEQQLVDYIKKAQAAGQSDDQSRSLLTKNGWTAEEINDAFTAITGNVQTKPQPQTQPQQQPQLQPQFDQQVKTYTPGGITTPSEKPKVEEQQTRVQIQRPAQPAQPQTQTQPQAQQPAAQTYRPQPEPQIINPQATMAAKPTDRQPGKRRGGALAVVIVVLILLFSGIGGVAYALYSQMWDPSWNPFAQSPDKVMAAMIEASKNVKTSRFDIKTELGSIANGNLFAFDMSGVADSTDSANFKSNFSVDVSSSGSSIMLANAVLANKNLFVRLNDFNFLGFDVDVSKIKGFWVKADENSIKTIGTALGQPNTQFLGQVLTGQINYPIDQLSGLFTFDKRLADTTVNGQPAYHYSLKLDSTKLGDLLGTSGILAQLGDVNMEVAIGKKDYVLYSAKINKTVDLSSVLSTVPKQMELKVTIDRSNINEPVTINEPQGAQKSEVIALPLIKNVIIAEDIRRIADYASLLSTNYSGLCYGSLLNGYQKEYGKELVDLNGDIIKRGGTRVTCLASATDYCISTQLADESFLCMSKANILGKVKCATPQTVCK